MRRQKGSGSTLRAGSSLLRDPVLAGLVVFGVLGSVWFVADLGGDRLQVRVLWLLQLPTDVTFSLIARRVGAVAGVSRPARRFWYVMSAAGLMFTIGDTVQTVGVLLLPTVGAADGGLVQSAFFILGCSAILLNMLMYPTLATSRGTRLRFWLDATTVLVGAAVLAWCFAINPTGAHRIDWVATAATMSMALVATFAAVKLTLTGAAPVSRSSAAPMIAATVVQGVESFLALHAQGTPGMEVQPGLLALRLVPSVLLALGPRVQELQTRANPATFTFHRARQYNLLPYGAVAVTYVVLLVILPGDLGSRVWGAVAGVVAITAMVVARQLLTFHDNFDLISRLDTTLLELRGHQALLHEQATHDGLTRLANRTAFADRVTEALAASGPLTGIAVLLIDLDDFKTVNDTLGHGVGDILLVTVAERLRGAVRGDDVVARFGGDEFAVLLRGVSDDDAAHFAARILADIAQPVRIGDHTLVVRASIGVAPAAPGDDLDGLLRNADIAMYAAKDGGKSSFQQYAPDMGARILETAELGTRLRDAIGSDQFRLVYQPIVDLTTSETAGVRAGSVVGAEALVRWQHPDRGPISPDDFIPAAERTGLIVPLGRWILREACRQAAQWRRAHPGAAALMLSVNVAGRQLQEPGFVDEVATTLAETGLPPDRLIIEVTETAVIHIGGTTDTLHALRRLGVGLALDDFGTAASSLGLLLTCPVSSLKLDRSFVDGVVTGSRQAAVATAVVQIARALDLSVVAEGIETPEQADLLQRLGYRLAQGYLFSRPLPSQEFERMWATASVT